MRSSVDRAVMAVPVRHFQMSLNVGGANSYVAQRVIFAIYATEDQRNKCQANIDYIESIRLSHSTLSHESINDLLHAISDLRAYLKHLAFFAGEQHDIISDARAAIKIATRSFFENIVDSLPACATLEPGQLGYQSAQRFNMDNDKKLKMINDYLCHYHLIPFMAPLRLRYPNNAPMDLSNNLDSFINSIEFNDASLSAWEKRLRTQNIQHLSHYLEQRVHEIMACKEAHHGYFKYILNKLEQFTQHLEKRAHFDINLMREAVHMLHCYNQPLTRPVQPIMMNNPSQYRLYPIAPRYLVPPPVAYYPQEPAVVHARPKRSVHFFSPAPETYNDDFAMPRASSPRG